MIIDRIYGRERDEADIIKLTENVENRCQFPLKKFIIQIVTVFPLLKSWTYFVAEQYAEGLARLKRNWHRLWIVEKKGQIWAIFCIYPFRSSKFCIGNIPKKCKWCVCCLQKVNFALITEADTERKDFDIWWDLLQIKRTDHV